MANIAAGTLKGGTFGLSVQNYHVGTRHGFGLEQLCDFRRVGCEALPITSRWAPHSSGSGRTTATGPNVPFAFDLGAYFATESGNRRCSDWVPETSASEHWVSPRISPFRNRCGPASSSIWSRRWVWSPSRTTWTWPSTWSGPFYPNGRNGLNVGVEYTHVTTIGAGNSLAISLRGGQKSSVPMVFWRRARIQNGWRPRNLPGLCQQGSQQVYVGPEDTCLQRCTESLSDHAAIADHHHA